jgi:hypothetical protein
MLAIPIWIALPVLLWALFGSWKLVKLLQAAISH